uniref:Putative capsid protein n=1 Tax=viral metagenome TaxID=1070528 RepID=A0A6M3K2D6_9ZZZZ
MASGSTSSASLADSLPKVISSARTTREQKGGIQQLCERHTLGEGIGNDWNEITLPQLSAQRITETTELDNPQQITDTISSITPTMVAVQTRVTDRTARRISKNVYALIGKLAQEALERLIDEDGVAILDTGATTASPGAGAVLTTGNISAAKVNASSDTTEPAMPPFRCALHGWQMHDLHSELVAGVGTYPIGEGPTADVLRQGFMISSIASCSIHENGNISIDSSGDAIGGVFAQEAILYIQGKAPWGKVVDKPYYGGGATDILLYAEYAYGTRGQSSWVQELKSDATAPTG